MATEIAWLKQLRQASWRDVPFQVDSIDLTAGQNTVLREYPFQDLPTVFSMGASAEEIKFSAYVIGDDYLDRLNALRDVLNGDGILIHPTQGSIRCYFHGKYTVKEAPASEGGIARLDLTFVRAEERRYPVAKENTTEKLAATSETAKQSIADTFTSKFNIDGAPGWSLDNLRTGMRDGFETVWSGVSSVQKEMNKYDDMMRQFVTNPTNELFALKGVIGNMVSSVTRVPDDLTSALSPFGIGGSSSSGTSSAARGVATAAAAAGPALTLFSNLRSMWSEPPATDVRTAYQSSGVATSAAVSEKLAQALTPPASPFKTVARQREAAAFQALADLVEGMTTVAAAQVVAQIDLSNYDQALALRQDFNQQFGKLLRRGVADHDVLMSLHTAVLVDLQARSQELARVMSYTPETWQPVIYISYRLFGTVAWADEIMAMNPHIKNPLLVPPGIPLRIVKRD